MSLDAVMQEVQRQAMEAEIRLLSQLKLTHGDQTIMDLLRVAMQEALERSIAQLSKMGPVDPARITKLVSYALAVELARHQAMLEADVKKIIADLWKNNEQ